MALYGICLILCRDSPVMHHRLTDQPDNWAINRIKEAQNSLGREDIKPSTPWPQQQPAAHEKDISRLLQPLEAAINSENSPPDPLVQSLAWPNHSAALTLSHSLSPGAGFRPIQATVLFVLVIWYIASAHFQATLQTPCSHSSSLSSGAVWHVTAHLGRSARHVTNLSIHLASSQKASQEEVLPRLACVVQIWEVAWACAQWITQSSASAMQQSAQQPSPADGRLQGLGTALWHITVNSLATNRSIPVGHSEAVLCLVKMVWAISSVVQPALRPQAKLQLGHMLVQLAKTVSTLISFSCLC